ncbi:hypothetical protein Tco_1235213 [Tanacetum coccineum]
MLLMQAQENGVVLDEEQLLFLAGGQDNAIDEDVDEQPVQDLALNVDNVFQADDCDAYDSDVDEAPTAQTMFMANLSSVDPVYDEAGPSFDSNVLSEYVKDNAVPVVQNNASMVPNDAYVMIDNDVHESDVLSVSHTPRNTVVNNLLNAELATYKEQVELYERRARQLFSEFEKTCKKRITPTGITEGERGFEQTKTCYLTEDKHDEIERKNLLIEHDNIIADGLSKEVFYVASNSELNVSRFTEMQKAHNVVKARCLELEAELSNLRDNIHKDNYNELLNRFSNLEVKPKVLAPGKYAIDVEPIPPRNRNNREVHLVYLRHLKESVDTLREIVEEAKVERPLDRSLASACRYTKHSQELLEYVFGTCPKVFNQQDKKHANTPRKKQVTFEDQIATSSSTTHKHVEPMHTQKSNVPVPPSTGVNSCTDASGSQLAHTQENMDPQPKVTA